jgi:phosphatidylinositol-3-phosphatase
MPDGIAHIERLEPRCLFAGGLPRPGHVVIVVEENHSYSGIVGSPDAAYFNALAAKGALLDNSHALFHPSQPNYLALFSGSNQGVIDNATPAQIFPGPSLGGQAIAAGIGFTGYAEGLPRTGSQRDLAGHYVRRHNPWANFADVPPESSRPFKRFPKRFSRLPAISVVVPDLRHDMHDGSVRSGDNWLRRRLDRYARWAQTHNSLLIVTWDEDDGSADNHIPTLFVGPMIRPGTFNEPVNHFNVLRTIEDMYDLAPLGAAADATPISAIFV